MYNRSIISRTQLQKCIQWFGNVIMSLIGVKSETYFDTENSFTMWLDTYICGKYVCSNTLKNKHILNKF